jgi:hypothetical protein
MCVKCGTEQVSASLGLCTSCRPVETDEDEAESHLRDEYNKLRIENEKLKQFIAHKELTADWTEYIKKSTTLV